MAIIESSRQSGLSQMKVGDPYPLQEPEGTAINPDNQNPEAAGKNRSGTEIVDQLKDWIENPNIARDYGIDVLDRLGMLVVSEYEIDEQSRGEWKDMAQKALKFATQQAQPKQYPWPEASNIIFPLITSAAVEFAAMAYPAVISGRNVVKGIVWGDDDGTPATQNGKPDGTPQLHPDGTPVWLVQPGTKVKRARTIGEHMSWQLLEEMEEWEPQTDQALHQMAIVGGFVRKTYRDIGEDKTCSRLVPLMNLVWNMHAPSFEKAPRKTEILSLYPNDVVSLERAEETFLLLPYGPGDEAPAADNADAPAPNQSDTEAPRIYLEQHRNYDLDGDGYAEPLIVTVHKSSSKVVRITARYDEDGILETKTDHKVKSIVPVDSYTLYPFLPNLEGGSYPIGFGHLLKPLNEAINTTMNQMFDAGHLQIAGGGFIGSGLSIHAGPTTFTLGEYKPVNSRGGTLRDNIYPMPWPGPSPVLFQLLGFLVEAAKQVASIKDALTGDTSLAQTAPTTMLALVQQGMRVYTAIYKRVYRSLKSEFAKLYRLNRLYLEEDERYRIGDTWRVVTPDDYRLGGGVEPWSDPTMVTDMQRLTRASLVADRAEKNPLVNKLEAERRLFEAAQIDKIDQLLPDKMPPPQTPPDVQVAQQELQLKMQTEQSKMGLNRAQEMQAYTLAMLNFQKARTEMSAPQIQWTETQLELMRMHIEALNTTVKAAAIDVKSRADNLRHGAAMAGHFVAHHSKLADVASRAAQTANEQPQPRPGNDSDGTDDLSEPGGAGASGSGLSAMAPSPGNSMLPAIPGAAGEIPSGGGASPLPGADAGGS